MKRRLSRSLLIPLHNDVDVPAQSGRGHRLKLGAASALLLVSCCVIGATVVFPGRTDGDPILSQLSTQPWTLESSLNDGRHYLIDSAILSPTHEPKPIEHTLTRRFMSARCADEWISTGQLCEEVQSSAQSAPAQIDVLFTWGNGSTFDSPMAEWRAHLSGRGAEHSADVARHFREHDELKFAMRAVVESLGSNVVRKIHLVTGDSPAASPEEDSSTSQRLVQVPHFVDSKGTDGQLVLHPHSAIFKVPAGQEPADVTSWREAALPSFNSLAIESQLSNVPDTAETVLVLNDDMFLLSNMSASDIATPLYGPVFRFSRHTLVEGDFDPSDDPEGEWRGLKITNAVLDRRFGKRVRPYVLHQGKSFSTALHRELQANFPDELAKTALARFRGSQPFEVQLAFLFTHFVIEKHREALLWSYFVARSDKDHDGTLSPSERLALLVELGYDGSSHIITARTPVRDTIAESSQQLRSAQLEEPLVTDYVFSSMEGFAHFTPDDDPFSERPFVKFAEGTIKPAASPICTLDVGTCFGEVKPLCTIDVDRCFSSVFLSDVGDVSAVEAMKRAAFEEPRCGDCIIVQLLAKSGRTGLEAFLPSVVDDIDYAPPASTDQQNEPCVLDPTNDWRQASYNDSRCPITASSARQTAIGLIRRYSYVIGESRAKLYRLTGPRSLKRALRNVERSDKAFATFNDDMSDTADVARFDEIWHEWFERRWPIPGPWERQ